MMTPRTCINDGCPDVLHVDRHSTLRIATWNVLTLAKDGYTKAICHELSRYRVNIADLTEA